MDKARGIRKSKKRNGTKKEEKQIIKENEEEKEVQGKKNKQIKLMRIDDDSSRFIGRSTTDTYFMN